MVPNLLELLQADKIAKRAAKREERKAGYRRRRVNLILFLGGKCKGCDQHDPDKLEFHHLRERTWVARKTSRWVRIARYWREAREGLIELRCGDCNKRLGNPKQDEETEWVDAIEGEGAPF